jgi:predicted phosphodiesterase
VARTDFLLNFYGLVLLHPGSDRLMRLAFCSDIHGNRLALEAVLGDIQEQGGADAHWIVGDLVALGPDPVGVLEQLAHLPNLTAVRGNTDRYITTGTTPEPTLASVQADPARLPLFATITRSLGWTQGAITVAGWLPWLNALPLEQRLTLPDGTRLLAVHAAPGEDDGDGIHPGLREQQLRRLAQSAEADLILVGHTHWSLDVTVDGVRFVNLGSVSNPLGPDRRASYWLLEADATGYQLQHQRVGYDHQAVIQALQDQAHPSAEYLIQFQRGERQPHWPQASS